MGSSLSSYNARKHWFVSTVISIVAVGEGKEDCCTLFSIQIEGTYCAEEERGG